MKEYYSTVEVAKLCSVTRFSVINWTKQDVLRSIKTPGGHRRIHRMDLITFIKTYKIGTDALKSEKLISDPNFLRCWEFHKSSDRSREHNCKVCVVFLSGAKKCFTLREHIGHQKVFCQSPCVECGYYKSIHLDQEAIKDTDSK